MTTRSDAASYGLLQTLSPEMARDIGDAFSLESIGRRVSPTKRDKRTDGSTRALRLASRLAAFLVVSAIAVGITLAAVYLTQIS